MAVFWGVSTAPLKAPASAAVAEASQWWRSWATAESVRFFSSTEMAFVEPGDVPQVMARQVMAPVKFAQSVSAVRGQVEVAVEVGPGRVLSGLVKKIAPDLTVLSTDGEEALLRAAQVLVDMKARGGRQ